MAILDIIQVIKGALGNVCIVGTIIVLILFVLTCIVRNNIINRTTIMLTTLMIFMWTINIGCIVFLLIRGGDSAISSILIL